MYWNSLDRYDRIVYDKILLIISRGSSYFIFMKILEKGTYFPR